MIQQQGTRKKEYACLCCFRSTKLKHLEATVKTTITHWKLSTLSRKLFPVCKTTCRRTDDGVFDDFPKISDHFPKIFQNYSEGQTNVPENFPKIFENFRSFPKISEDSRRLSRKTRRCFDPTPEKSSISSLVRIWKICHSSPGCRFVWILRVVYFLVKYSR